MGEDTFYPLEFFVSGTPASQQATNSKPVWMERVGSAAKICMDELVEFSWLDKRPVEVLIFYFPSAPMQGDIDNIVKPILDALVGVAYPDDHVIERITVQKFEPESGWTFAQPTATLSAALDSPTPFTYIRLDDTLAWRQIS